MLTIEKIYIIYISQIQRDFYKNGIGFKLTYHIPMSTENWMENGNVTTFFWVYRYLRIGNIED